MGRFDEKLSSAMRSQGAVVIETGSMEEELPSQSQQDCRKDKMVMCNRCRRGSHQTMGPGNSNRNN
jgi:hypothetical protein